MPFSKAASELWTLNCCQEQGKQAAPWHREGRAHGGMKIQLQRSLQGQGDEVGVSHSLKSE